MKKPIPVFAYALTFSLLSGQFPVSAQESLPIPDPPFKGKIEKEDILLT